MKKIIIYVNSLNRGGAERVSVILAEYMKRKHVQCILVTECIRENEYNVPEGVKRISIGADKRKYLNFFRNVLKLRKILKKEAADIMLIMDIPGCLLAIPASRGLNIKVIVSERNDPYHFPGKKIVVILSRKLMKLANGFVFQTKDAQSFYEKKLNNKGIIIYNPLENEKLPNVYLGEREKSIVSVGRLSPQKNQKLLIDAFSLISNKFPEYNLIIYGEGELRNKLETYIKMLNLENKVLLPGNIPNVLNTIKSKSLFVLTSDYEGMPNALIEAMSLGITCISTDCPCGGPKSIIENEKNGLLVPVGNAEMLSQKIAYCLTNKVEAKKMGKEAVKIRKKMDMNIICSQWYNYMDSI